LDRCAEHLRRAGIEDFLIHGGNSSVLARGAQGSAGPDSPGGRPAGWIVGLPHPLRPDRRLHEIRLRDRSLGTSGSQAQSFWHEGRRYGHILDPRTGWPARNALTATAVAPSAMLADALSTAFYVMRPEEVLDYCRARPHLAAIVICPARRHGGFELKTIGLDEGEMAV
jgi:thiamine biosynthesis lipoprotein